MCVGLVGFKINGGDQSVISACDSLDQGHMMGLFAPLPQVVLVAPGWRREGVCQFNRGCQSAISVYFRWELSIFDNKIPGILR